MNMSAMKNALSEYKQVDVQGGIEGASPHRLIQMLINGAIEKISSAIGYLENNNIAKKGETISWAISIIDGLRVSLDKSVGGDIAQNLDALYEYMSHRLIEANLKNDPAILTEVGNLMREIKAGWDGIEEHAAKIEASRQP